MKDLEESRVVNLTTCYHVVEYDRVRGVMGRHLNNLLSSSSISMEEYYMRELEASLVVTSCHLNKLVLYCTAKCTVKPGGWSFSLIRIRA
jgi:hypothetical protein